MDYYNEWLRLQNEINKHKVDIDFECFRKTETEKQELKWAKQEWKNDKL